MKSIRALLAILAAQLIVVGCASDATTSNTSNKSEFHLQIVDDPQNLRFLLLLESQSPIPLCLQKEGWPSDSGLPYSVSAAQLRWDQGEIKSIGHSAGICIGGCGSIEIPPYGRLHGYIDYSAFGNPEVIAKLLNRVVEYEVHPTRPHQKGASDMSSSTMSCSN